MQGKHSSEAPLHCLSVLLNGFVLVNSNDILSYSPEKVNLLRELDRRTSLNFQIMLLLIIIKWCS